MANALDMFRAQREAADQIHARLRETADLMVRLQSQVDAVTKNEELRLLLRQEQLWLERLKEALAEARRFRDLEERRFWPSVWRRWFLIVAFALAAAAAAGAGFAWATQPHLGELEQPRSRAGLADDFLRRMATMSPYDGVSSTRS